MLYFFCCNLILLLVHLKQEYGCGEEINHHPLYVDLLHIWKLQPTLPLDFPPLDYAVPVLSNCLCLYFLGHLCFFFLGTLHLSSTYMCIQHSIPVKWNNYASCLTLKTSHLGVLTLWLLFSHHYRICCSLWCIIKPPTCFFNRTDAYVSISYPATDCS